MADPGITPLMEANTLNGNVILRGGFCDTWLSLFMTPETADRLADELKKAASGARENQLHTRKQFPDT